jgi:hypothetical protein
VAGGTVLSDAEISDWCRRSLGAGLARVRFRSGHLAQVVGVGLADGQSAVIKVRPSEARIAGCVAVQAHLARAGFPCPAPLAGPALVRGWAVTAETLIDGGGQLPPGRGAVPFAALLAGLVGSAPDIARVPALAPSPPWTAWGHAGSGLWPDRDDQGRDLNARPGPGWVDAAARGVRQCLSAGQGRPRWAGERALAVDDWYSVIAQPETAIVGLASAVWPAAGGPADAATVEQSADFIAAYQVAAGIRWNETQVQHAWAAGLWVRLVNAKKDAAAGGGAQLDRLAGEVNDRLSLAGVRPRNAR